ncbi:metallophosphoesterase [Vibrio cyclitrophicus]
MKICHLSDLHLEFAQMECPQTDADVVVLSGDIHLGTKGIDWAAQFDVPVVYVLGNHEAYGASSLELLIEECRDKAELYSNIYFLENDSVVINGVRFHGCTLWTDFELYETPKESMKLARSGLNDYRNIRYNGKPFSPLDAREIHQISRRFLYESIEQAQESVNVVVTHHLPSREGIQLEYLGSPLGPAFASQCDEFAELADKIAVWFYGHNHDCMEFSDFNIKFHTNQRGYVGYEEVSSFDPLNKILISS